MRLSRIVRTFKTELRKSEVYILLLILVLSTVTLTTTLTCDYFLNQQVLAESEALLGGGAELSSNQPVPTSWKQQIKAHQLRHSEQVSFFSMVYNQEALTLANVQAIATPYPLIGHLVINTGSEKLVTNSQPNLNQIWVTASLLDKLNITLGSQLSIGEKAFKVTGIIEQMPGLSNRLIEFTPTVIMPLSQLQQTKVIQPGSRATYSILVSGTALAPFMKTITPTLNQHQKVVSAQNTFSIKAINKHITQSLQLISMFAFLLTAIAVSLCSQRYCLSQQKAIALIKAFGIPSMSLYVEKLSLFLLLGFFAVTIGLIAALFLPSAILFIISNKFTWAISLSVIIKSMAIHMMGLLIFSSAHFLSLLQVKPALLFRQVTVTNHWSEYAMLSLGLLFLTGVFYSMVNDFQLMLVYVFSLIDYFILIFLILLLIKQLYKHIDCKMYAKLAYARLFRQLFTSTLQLFSIATILFILLSSWSLQDALLNHWQQLFPPKTPNHFLVNIEEDQLTALSRWFDNKKITTGSFYPMVRGRLIKINDSPVNQLFQHDHLPRALQRELNLSTMMTLPINNRTVEGQFAPSLLPSKHHSISIEQGVANRLKIKMGDSLTFSIMETPVTGTVTHIRSVSWQSFSPNFFVIFNPEALEDQPRTYITSLYYHNPHIDQQLVTQFPNINIINMDTIVQELKQIVSQFSQVLDILLILVLLIGLSVLWLIFQTLRIERIKEQKILFFLGTTDSLRKRISRLELSSLLLGASTLASVTAYALSYFLIEQKLMLTFHANFWLFITLPLICIGYLIRQISRHT